MMNKPYTIRFHCVDETEQPYTYTKYSAYFSDGTVKKGNTDGDGYTSIFSTEQAEDISLHLEVATHSLHLDI